MKTKRSLLLLVTPTLITLALAAGCAGSETSGAAAGAQTAGGEEGASTSGGAATEGETGDPEEEAGEEPTKDGGAKPSADAGDTDPPGDPDPPTPPAGGPGITLTVNGDTYSDPNAMARRSKWVSGPKAGTFSGNTYVSTPPEILGMKTMLTFNVNGGGAYLTVGSYPCGEARGSQTPSGRSHVSVIFPNTSWTSEDNTCVVKVTSAGASGAGAYRIVGTISGTLVNGLDGTSSAVKGSFDLGYQN